MEKLTAANSWNANKVRELELELQKSNRVIDSLSQELDAIKSTRGYRILEKMRTMKMHFAGRKEETSLMITAFLATNCFALQRKEEE